MPDRFSISGSSFGTRSFNDPTTWYGGIVPTASDNVFIRGVRTTLASQVFNVLAPGPGAPGFANIINDGLMFWPGTQSFVRVNDTTDFPISGSFFTYTDRDVEVKIDYEGISSSFYFVNCKVDKAYSSPWGSGSDWMTNPPLPSQVGGVIPPGAFIQFRPGLIVISGSATASVYQTTIQNGGKLELRDSSSYFIGNYISMSDGFLTVKDFTTVNWNYNYVGTASTFVANNPNLLSASYLSFGNTPFCQVSFEGRELRTNTTLSLSASVGDSYLSVVSASRFETGDWIFVGEEDLLSIRTDDGSKDSFRGKVSSEDECFYVALKDTGSTPNRLYVQRMNGLQGKVFATSSATEIIVDEERYNVGDKVIINGQVRTIIEVTSSYDYQLRDYNFQSGSNLDDWDYNPERSPLHSGWALAPGFGLTNQQNMNAGTYKQAVVKDIFRDNVKIEAWISNFMQITASTTDSGSRSGNTLGVLIHADPLGDFSETGPALDNVSNATNVRTYLGVTPSTRRFYLANRGNYESNFMLLPNLGITNTEGLLKYTAECTQGFIRGYINDVLVQETFAYTGVFAGRVGLFTTNPKFVCTRFIVYAKCQKIKLDSPVTGVKANDIVYETGVEIPHSPGNKVIKLYSKVVDPLNHVNLAFGYRGFSEYQGDNAFPYVFAVGNDGRTKQSLPLTFIGTGNASSPVGSQVLLLNNTYVDNRGTVQCGSPRGSVTVDFSVPTTFNNVAFTERYFPGILGGNFTSSLNNGNTISGSNDSLTWFPLTASIDPRLRSNYFTLRDFQLPAPVTYRYVRLEAQGLTGTYNYWAGLGVFDLGTNSFTSFAVRNLLTASLQLNNTSDLNVGDRVMVLYKNQLGNWSTRYNQSFAAFVSGSSSLLDNSNDYFTITAKSASVITLDRFIPYIIDKDTYVYKVNKTVNFTGSFSSGSTRTGRLWGALDTQFQSKISFKNVGMQFFDDGFPFQNTTSRGAWSFLYNNFYNPLVIQGCSFYNNLSAGNGWYSNLISSYKTHVFARHNFVFGTNLQGIQKNGAYSGAYIYTTMPYVYTANTVYGLDTSPIQSAYTTFNSSYNIYFSSNDFNYGISFFQTFQRTHGQYYKINRNLYNNSTFVSYNENLSTNQPFYSSTDNFFFVEIKNNKINALNLYGGGLSANLQTRPIINSLLPDKQSLDFYRIGNVTGLQNQFLSGPSQVGVGVPTNLHRNYNRYNYNLWTHTYGMVVKFNNDSWYRHYMYTSRNYKTGIYVAHIHVAENVSSSFEVGFDYYNDNSQIAFSEASFTGSFASALPVPQAPQFAGALCVFVLKDGKEIANRVLPKTGTPQSYYERFVFDGKGVYHVCLGTSNNVGFVALKNINSKFNAPPSNLIMVKSNPFTMKYFENNADKVKSVITTNIYPKTNNKFRLSSKKLF
jgi:hypothetical protein